MDVEIEIGDRLLTGVLTDEWRGNHYPLLTPGDVAGHLAYNLVQGRRLTSLDGFADQPEDAARVLDISVDDDVEEDTRSPKPKPRPKPRGQRRPATPSRRTL